ncbi:MAG: Nif3-like dinuclear metal center hexameric protein [Bacteroidales bacterium]|nr:Nif3-like dinuclear metal center hexameric protein [Bacteroidales bacterium]
MRNRTYIQDIIFAIEEVAPLHWQESYDNAGLIIGDVNKECSGVLICLDVFASTVRQAVEKKCNLIISHHPFIFHGIKKLEHGSQITNILTLAIKNDIAVYSAHTNMDSSLIGVNAVLGEKLFLGNISPLDNERYSSETNFLGSGAVGVLEQECRAEDYLQKVKKSLNLYSIRYAGNTEKKIKKVGYCGGSGSFLIDAAIQKGCDMFLTGDLKYHDFLSCEDKIIIADIGHFESEQFIKQRFFDIISKKICNFAPLYITKEENRVKFL